MNNHLHVVQSAEIQPDWSFEVTRGRVGQSTDTRHGSENDNVIT